MAFVKINGQPLTKILVAAFGYFWQPRFYLWKRTEEQIEIPKLPKIGATPAPKAPLKDLLLKISTTTRPIEKREKPSKSLSLFRITKETLETFRKTTGERDAARRVDYR